MTVTHNREGKRRDGWHRRQGQGQRVEKMVVRGTRGKGQREWRRVGGLGTRRFVSRPRDRGHVIGHVWPW